jgi:transcriptional regulator with XRE-family HTH domain
LSREEMKWCSSLFFIKEAEMNRLKRARVLEGINQCRLSILTGIHRTTISLIENDLKIPTPDQREKIARILDFEVKQIWPSDQ